MRNSRYWMGLTDWFIDDAGSREASGADAGHPIPEIERQFRMGVHPRWTSSAYHLRYLTDTDSVFLAGERGNANIFIHGSAADNVGQSVLYSGSITALTALNRVAASGGQPILITSSGLPVSWTSSGLVRQRMRRTSDNATAWVMKDLGAKQCRSTEWTIGGTFISPFTVPTTAAVPVNGDAFAVERLTKIKSLRIDMVGRLLNSTFQGINFDSVEIGETNIHGNSPCAYALVGSVLHNASSTDTALGSLNFSSSRLCGILGLAFPPFARSTTFNGGMIDSDGVVGSVVQLSTLHHGLINRLMTQDITVIMTVAPGGNRGGWSLGSLGIFDSNNDALVVESPGSFFFNTNASILWGSGSPGIAIRHRAQGSWYYEFTLALGTNLNLVGASGDILFSGRTQCRAFDDSVGTYTGLRNLTFANLVGAIGAGGFSPAVGQPMLVDPVSGCAITTTQ